MSISRKDWEDENFKIYRGSALKIIEFLRANKDTAYTSKEVAQAVGISPTSSTITLRNLIKANFVESKKPYYILKAISAKKKSNIGNIKKDEESEEELVEEGAEE